jgi:hypothetical protein
MLQTLRKINQINTLSTPKTPILGHFLPSEVADFQAKFCQKIISSPPYAQRIPGLY